jgi:hypothetical protein
MLGDTTLESLARALFIDLTPAEIKLLQAAPTGDCAVCGPNNRDDDPLNDPAKADEWGQERRVRPDLIRWICVDRQAKEIVDPRGIQIYGAKISERLDLSYTTVPFGLTLTRCRVLGQTYLVDIEIVELDFQGCWVDSIVADLAKVKGAVFLRAGFHSTGEVRLLGAQIGGGLLCGGATFDNLPRAGIPGSGEALKADLAVVQGSICLNKGFRAKGEVRLLGVRIAGNLDCSDGSFENPVQPNLVGSGAALSADSAVVEGSIFLSEGFRADGDVRLLGVQVGCDLTCTGSKFAGELIAERASVKATLHWNRIVDAKDVRLDLVDTSVGTLVDDVKSWPARGNLCPDGFVYKRISGDAPKDAQSRLGWLDLQDGFARQPYRQLAKVLKDEGDEVGARHVLFEMERRRRAQDDREPRQRLWSWTLKTTIGYGYHSVWALWWLLGLMFIWSGLYWGGYCVGSMVPTDKSAYCAFEQDRNSLPAFYEHFHAVVYSLENSFPLVKLGQLDRWQPDPSPHKYVICIWNWPTCFSLWISLAGSIRWLRWIQTLLGWILATLFVAGVTGIVRRE